MATLTGLFQIPRLPHQPKVPSVFGVAQVPLVTKVPPVLGDR